MYADDLVIWWSEENVTTATYRIQEALRILEEWTKNGLWKSIPEKNTYTIFSLSPKDTTATLIINNQTLPKEGNLTYLGVTFDKRVTWKQQSEKAETRGKARLAIMKKLAGTTWGADAGVL